jgi:transposase
LKTRQIVLARLGEQDLSGQHVSPGFLSTAERKELLSLARDGSAEHRIARRANAILLLDDGLSCERVAKVLYLDDDTVRGWRKLHDERGIAGLEQFDAGGSSSRLSSVQEEALKAYVAQALPRSTRQMGAFIVRAKRVPQLLISFDECLLFFRIEFADDDFRLVVFQAQPVQKRDQSRTAFVNDTEFPLDD